MQTKFDLEIATEEAQQEFYETMFTNFCKLNELKIDILIKMMLKLKQHHPKIAELFKDEFRTLELIKKKEQDLKDSMTLI